MVLELPSLLSTIEISSIQILFSERLNDHLHVATFTSWVLGNVEVLIRSIIVAKNQNFQAYLCVFFVFPSSPLSCRLSIFILMLPSIHFPDRHFVFSVFNSLISVCELRCGSALSPLKGTEIVISRSRY